MAPTIIDIDEAMIAGVSKVDEWEREWQEAFYAPMLMVQAVMSFMSLPPEALAQMQAEDSDLFDEMKAYVARMKGVQGRGQVQESAEVPAEEGYPEYQPAQQQPPPGPQP